MIKTFHSNFKRYKPKQKSIPLEFNSNHSLLKHTQMSRKMKLTLNNKKETDDS